ncbi:DUF6483 family protein [Lacticaseibacillus jixiensis]|uniref:DUF6483 family protein n=1 Tax=Lacticaseibacillus jixiensis TaxID=3231926 RepID=UPI0036F354CA
MQEENDVLLRQIKAFAQGLGYLLGKGNGSAGNEIVFPQQATQKLPNQAQLEQFLAADALHEATSFLFSRRYAMAEEKFIALGMWYFGTLNKLSDEQLTQANYSREAIALGLAQLGRIQRGEA